MGIILIIDEDNIFTDKMPEIFLQNHKTILLNENNHLKYFIEEYMPEYIILSEKNSEFNEISDYIRKNTGAGLVITDSESKRNSGPVEFGFTGRIKDKNDMKKILITLDNLNNKEDQDKSYKFIKQEVISVYSIQGGVGKTTIAFNLAWYLGRILKQKILLIDLNFCEGPSDLALNLNLDLLKNMGGYIKEISKGNSGIGDSVNTLYDYIDIMHPPLSICQSDRLNTDILDNLIYSARSEYQMIIADVPFRYDNISLEMLNLSTTSILVLSPDIVMAPRVDGIQKLLPENQKKNIVFNKIDNSRISSLREYARFLEMPVLGWISYIPDGEKREFNRQKNSLHILDIQSEMAELDRLFF